MNQSFLFPDRPCMERVYKDEKALFHWSAARNKERLSPHLFPDMPCMNRVYRDKKVLLHCSAARNNARFSSR